MTEVRCTKCATRYPVVSGVPWLYREPDLVLGEWRNRLRLYQDDFISELRAVEADLAVDKLSTATRRRLMRLRDAYGAQREAVAQLLDPLRCPVSSATGAVMRAFGIAVPRRQDLHSYYANLHRDWCWGLEENAREFSAVSRRLPGPVERMLVLGAGGCRLAYDLHQAACAAETVCLDINPLLFLTAKRVIAGEKVSLYEFPIAPQRPDDCAVHRVLEAPTPARDGLSFVFGDAFEAPFPSQAFDVVLTPWLLDIVERDFADLARQINRVLRTGGTWVNHGSVSFAGRRPLERYGLDEVSERVTALGFSVPEVDEQEITYLCSPSSRHARIERVVTFSCSKERAVMPASPAPVPDWLRDPRVAVPASSSFETAAIASRIQAFVLALVDGRRSAADIASALVNEGLLEPQSAMAAVRALLLRLYEEELRPPPS
jgi:SAM-dependent methyltransferase